VDSLPTSTPSDRTINASPNTASSPSGPRR
jgi:hypothetical protein